MSVPWDSSSSLARVSYTPGCDSGDVLLALAGTAPSAVDTGVPWNSSQSLARPNYAPANDSGDVLLELVLAPSTTNLGGVPWDSSQSLARANYAPANQCDDVLLELVAPFGPWLDTPAAISRYTIITLAQEDAAELARVAPPLPYFDMAEPWAIGKVLRSALLARIRVHDDALPGIAFTPYFVQAGEGRTERGTYRHRIAFGKSNMLSPKDPDAIEWMTRDCSKLLAKGADGTIASILSEAFEEGDGACTIVVAAAVSTDGLKWSIKVAGGTSGETYRYRVRILTTAGETLDTSIEYFVTDPVN